ncbi:hypothetical protein Poli38472_007018 [Pythium oligandrum]|uniref:NADP-dependent oxidoreductase domain-containing protein n=1 Tax=Pythium oligandrum TaxID=41045 RepID=A0A8K1FHK9_PYTOL|nr:hypothetical protein Poli38472_007018 [Pythium oligandrum]|eukprot:TMW58873.1 hypothetical protein Poli38472_007018 [Pythium oligandrum]
MAAPSTPMKYRFLGDSGLLVSQFSYGSWFTGTVDTAYEVMSYGFKNGINFWDTAEGYSEGAAEKILGEVFHRGVEEKVWTREDLVISTKIFIGTKEGPNNRGVSRKHLIEGTKASLKRLQLDYVDVLFCHRSEPYTPIEETPQYNLFERSYVEGSYDILYKKYNYGLTTWSPLLFGLLTGKYANGIPEGSRLAESEYVMNFVRGHLDYLINQVERLRPIAEELDCSLAQLALAWCTSNQRVSTVILGASSVSQLEENLKALEVVPKLTEEVKARIEAIIPLRLKVATYDHWPLFRSKWL